MIASPEIRFPKFRLDRNEYEQSQREWLTVFNAALMPNSQTGWQDWLGDPFLEGTPIFSRVNRDRKKGIVINQILPSDDGLNFRAYLDIFAPDSAEDLVEHLVITTTLSDDSKRKAQDLIRKYLSGSHRTENIVEICESLTASSASLGTNP